MSPQEKLIIFMEEKALLFKKFYNINPNRYFKEKDKQSILEWSDKECKKIWAQLKRQVKHGGVQYFSFDTCIYCLKYSVPSLRDIVAINSREFLIMDNFSNCSKCEYRLVHGECSYAYSDYFTLSKKILRFKTKRLEDMFNTDVFKELISKVEEVCGK